MKPTHLIRLTLVSLFAGISSFAQTTDRFSLLLKSGTIFPEKNITADKLEQFDRSATRSSGKAFAVLQFEQALTENDKNRLRQSGIELLDYIPHHAYTVTITGTPDLLVLQETKARSLVELTASQKMDASLSTGLFPARAVKVPGTVDVWISFPASFSYETVRLELGLRNLDITGTVFKDYRILALRVAAQRLSELALLPFIEYVQPVPGEDKPLNGWTNWNRDGMKATLLNAPLSVGGRNLKGSGVVIGVGDNADPQSHVDFTGRLINRAAARYLSHGTHVAGIVGGAGLRDELRTGLAPKATILTQAYSGVFTNAPAYVADHGMVITNNSYGAIDECSYHGIYDLYSRILDQQAFSLPGLENIFAAGNSGSNTCAPYPNGFRTVFGGYQSAKNVLTVGNAMPTGSLFVTSSRGPVRDGRIKPEIIGIGTYIMSAGPPPYNYYWENTGTSMAAPGVAGGAGLIYERFRQLAGVNPRNVLVKALLCNGADDWGNNGPDYRHGFGLMNLWRSVDMLENNRIDSATITTGAQNDIVISVPAGLSKLKVMLAWNDPAAAVIASQTLVNDLDLEVLTPAPVTTVLPRVLDTIPANVNVVAGNGADHINNIEQVTIDNPAPGNYTFRVKGTAVPQNAPQQYFLVYDFVPVDIKLTGPVGGDTYIPGERILLQWDSYGDDASTFTLEFSPDNGANWNVLDAAVPANLRYWTGGPDFGFLVPNIATTQALIRVTKNATGASSTSFPFTILTQPVVTLAPAASQCEGYIVINWTNVTGATDYEVMLLQGNEMVPVTTTTGNSYTFSGLSKDSTYWVTVRARINGVPGRRALAIFRKPDTGSCTGTISDNDIKLDAIVSPVQNGRLQTSTALGNSIPVTIRIKNLDDAATSGNITASYTLNGGAPVVEVIPNPAIAAGGTLDYTFSSGNLDLSAAGNYTIDASVTLAGDPVTVNNNLTKTFRQLSNPAITGISYPALFLDNFDAAPVQSFTTRQTGLMGLDRYDFTTSSSVGRVRSFINSGMAYSGNRALTLDAQIYNAGGTVDSLTGTYNLATYNAASDDIRLDFRYKNHGQGNNPANRVWVRGDDTQSWVEVYNLFANQNEVDGTYKYSGSLEIGDFLQNAIPAQNFSSSFQVRFGQFGTVLAADNDGGAGYTFDDIRIYRVTDDMQLAAIDAPATASCALTATTPVTITVRNSSNAAVNNVPVSFRVNGGAWSADELVPFIAANSSASFTFTATANLAAPGPHLVEARVTYISDSYPENDTLSKSVVNSPVITVTNSNPYLQNFEAGAGSWYTGGKNSSWEYGTPVSTKINRAASGSKAWKTRLAGNYNDTEKSYLYSPCFDISGLSSPTLSLSIALDLEDCGVSSACDGAYMEYSADGTNWTRLGANGQGTNWYNRNYVSNNMWSVQNYQRWHVATIPLPAGQTQLRLRVVVATDQLVNRDGIGVDDIHIYSNANGIYEGTGASPVVNQPAVNGSNWVHFTDAGTNKLIASVLPNGQNLGSTDVQSFVHTGIVRNKNNQYYHNRNITIKPATVNLADSATVRFYFLDSETEALLNANDCGTCYKPTTAYGLGVSKYSDPDDNFENGTINDNNQGTWKFITPDNAVKVPFDKGYYAEFKVKDFSEFWLNNGGPGNSQTLPVVLTTFHARKKDTKDVLAEWEVASETNVDRYEIEMARGNAGYQQSQFVKLGEVKSRGNSESPQSYSFTDMEFGKTGVRYYRLKIIDNDGRLTYSPVRAVVFSAAIDWQVFPNPSAGIFNFSFQAAEGSAVQWKVTDWSGRTVLQSGSMATGFVQKIELRLDEQRFAPGLYLLEAVLGEEHKIFRLLKQ